MYAEAFMHSRNLIMSEVGILGKYFILMFSMEEIQSCIGKIKGVTTCYA